MKKKFFVGAAVGTAGLVALTGATFAHGGNGEGASDVKDRVAEILGIAPEDLQDAFEQAREEHRDEQIAERLASAVEEGVITQEEADSIIAWLDSKPEVLDGMTGRGHRGGIGNFVKATADEESIAQLVDRLVEAEKIGEEDAGTVTDWLSSAPTDALQKLGEPGDDKGRENRRSFRGRMFGEGPDGRLFEGRFQIQPYSPSGDSGDTGEIESGTAVSVGVSA